MAFLAEGTTCPLAELEQSGGRCLAGLLTPRSPRRFERSRRNSRAAFERMPTGRPIPLQGFRRWLRREPTPRLLGIASCPWETTFSRYGEVLLLRPDDRERLHLALRDLWLSFLPSLTSAYD